MSNKFLSEQGLIHFLKKINDNIFKDFKKEGNKTLIKIGNITKTLYIPYAENAGYAENANESFSTSHFDSYPVTQFFKFEKDSCADPFDSLVMNQYTEKQHVLTFRVPHFENMEGEVKMQLVFGCNMMNQTTVTNFISPFMMPPHLVLGSIDNEFSDDIARFISSHIVYADTSSFSIKNLFTNLDENSSTFWDEPMRVNYIAIGVAYNQD